MRAKLLRRSSGVALNGRAGLRAAVTAIGLMLSIVMEAAIAQPKAGQTNAAQDREIAARFAPVFYQSLGSQKRSDYITNFDFDGDWRGNNNWANAENRRFPMRAYVYYAVAETATHYFIHYAVFHPRDYKGGASGSFLSGLLREGVKLGGRHDPTGLAEDITLAHENDMEGCLVVVAKNGGETARSSVTAVETLAHSRFLKYSPDDSSVKGLNRVWLDDQRPLLYIEPKGHGIKAYEETEKTSTRRDMLVYRFAGKADDPEKQTQHNAVIGYELLSMYDTLWPRAREGVNETYGTVYDYAPFKVDVASKPGQKTSRQIKLGRLGVAFSGKVGAQNIARPPWGWFERTDREKVPGPWFFDPAALIKQRFKLGDNFSTAYVHAPFLGIFRP
ncbi:MAG: hypothetical protein WCF57_10120 [Pyrinomonadaceae bacterium]